MDYRNDLMRVQVYTNFLYPGMILKGDGYDEKGNMVIEKNIPLTQELIMVLKEKGVKTIQYTRERLKLKKNVSKNMVSDGHLEKAVSLIEDIHGMIKNEGSRGKIPEKDIDEVINGFISDIKDNSDAYINLLDLYHYDDYTYTHSINVATLAMLLGLSLNMEGDKVRVLGVAGLLHDIGKTMIPEKIIEKPSGLSSDEWKIVRNHPVYSYNIIRGSNTFGTLIENAILCHHENYTGGGYPFGIKHEKQNIYSQIITVADVFDAMTSRRPYKEPIPFHDSFTFFMENSGSKFNPSIAQVFLRDMARKINEEPIYPVNSFVILNSGEIAYVVGHRLSPFTLRPIVNIFLSPKNKERGFDKLSKHPIQIDLEGDYSRYIVKRVLEEHQIDAFNRIIHGM